MTTESKYVQISDLLGYRDARDTEYRPGPHLRIGPDADLCADVACPCGYSGHLDGPQLLFWRCACGKVYAVGRTVKLIPLPEHLAEAATRSAGFYDDLDADDVDTELEPRE